MNTKAMKILIVDDDADIRQMLSILLANDGYNTVQAENGIQAIEMFNDSVDLVLMDVMMPRMDGIMACIKLREKSNVPIILLTAKDTDMDQILGLGAGADDYISKPFSPPILSARIRTLLRRSNSYAAKDEQNVIKIRNLMIDLSQHKVTIEDESLKLTPTEFDILYLLMKNKGRVFSIEQIYSIIWDEPYMKSSSNTVMVHIRKLREKIEKDTASPEYLKTEWGVGYKID
ncbi:MAG: response regulator transcription factor [Eubacteriales bacterium]